MSAATTSAVFGRRACAVVAAGSAALHGFMAGHARPSTAVLIVAMACACLYCAWELWVRGTLRSWCVVAVMNLGMVAAHMALPEHHHGVAGQVTAAPPSLLMTVATTLAVVEAVVAAAVMWHRTRDNEARLAIARVVPERSDHPSLSRGAW